MKEDRMDGETKPRRLTRSNRNKMIAGVCGGLAEYLNMDPTVVRVLYVLVSILSAAFPGIVAYIILMFLMPPPEEVTA
jgi:phage shock protein C